MALLGTPSLAHETAALRAAGVLLDDGAPGAAPGPAPVPVAPKKARRRSGMHHVLVDMHAKTTVDPSCLETLGVVGEGGWATVEKAWYAPEPGAARQLVAVKRPKPAVFADPAQHDMWTAEVELMRKLQHSCIIGFVGAGAGLECGEMQRAFIVQELMEGGTLKSLVQRQMLQNPTPLYSDAAGLDICMQVARGLRYMHMAQPMVMHRDLKLDNIMLTSKKASPDGLWTAKIVDFGLSKIVAQQRQRVLQHLLVRQGGKKGAPHANGGANGAGDLTRAVSTGGQWYHTNGADAAAGDASGQAQAYGTHSSELAAGGFQVGGRLTGAEQYWSGKLAAIQANATASSSGKLAGAISAAAASASRRGAAGLIIGERSDPRDIPSKPAHNTDQMPTFRTANGASTNGCMLPSNGSLPGANQPLSSSAPANAEWEWRLKVLGSSAVPPDVSNPLHHVVVDNSLHGERFALTAETGSLMYMSPEVFRGENYNEKADGFSFGVVMYEVMHRYMMLSAICVKGTVEELEAYASSVAGGYRPPIDAKWPAELRSLIEDCWAHDPAKRPSMQEVVPRLQAIKERNLLSEYAGQGASCCTIC